MKKSEIEFCKWWAANEVDGEVPNDSPITAGQHVDWIVKSRLMSIGAESPPAKLTRRGADLVASYEAAVAQGLDIVADDAQTERACQTTSDHYDEDCRYCEGLACSRCRLEAPGLWEKGCRCAVDERHEDRLDRQATARDEEPCPDCEDGTIGIPIEYGPRGGILRIWPATCPTCSGSRVVPVAPKVEAPAPVADPADGWHLLTDEFAETLAGQDIELRRPSGEAYLRYRASLRAGTRETSSRTGRRTMRIGADDAVPTNRGWRVRIVKPGPAGPGCADAWQPLTRELAATLSGQAIGVRRGGVVLGRTVARRATQRTLWIDAIHHGLATIDALFIPAGYEVRLAPEPAPAWVDDRAGVIALLESAHASGSRVSARVNDEIQTGTVHRVAVTSTRVAWTVHSNHGVWTVVGAGHGFCPVRLASAETQP